MQFTNFLMLMLMTNYVTQDTQPHVIVFWDPCLLKLRNDRFKKIQNVITEAYGPKRKPDLDRGDILIS